MRFDIHRRFGFPVQAGMCHFYIQNNLYKEETMNGF